MPRYYRRRYTRVVKPKKKWASNIIVWNRSMLTEYRVQTLVSNKAQANAPTPTVLKVGNFKVTADLSFNLTTGSTTPLNPTCTAYILYVPEGWGTTITAFDNLIEKHPEWIMGTKVMGGNVVAGGSGVLMGVDTLNMSSRLKRNLNSGDSVVLYLNFNLPTAATLNGAFIDGNCRYWTCAN